MTNNTKAQIAVFLNSALLALLAFGIDMSGEQVAAVMIPVNAALALIQIATFRSSTKRIPD